VIVSEPLRLLLVEDSELDGELIQLELRRCGYQSRAARVDNERDLRTALVSGAWDIVLCDHGLPSFTSSEALTVVHDTDPDLPFVILSGTIGEEAAVESLKAGARDVVLKGNLSRLGPVIERELREAQNRQEQERLRRERAELESQLIQAQRLDAIGRLAAGVAHDYRNLLGVVLGFSDLALRTLSQEDQAHEYVSEIRTAGERAITLVDQLLTFSRQQESSAGLTDVGAVVRDIKPMLGQLVGDDVELELEVESELPPVLIDPGRLEQVIVNLAVNAREAMPHGGRFKLTTESIGSDVVLRAIDSGVGMDEDTRSRIFEPFYTTKADDGGTGLGLATSYGIVNQAGGSISVASQPGLGATFSVHLPQAQMGAVAALDQHDDDETATALGGSETILLVDDNQIFRKLLREALESTGYTVLDACNGIHAIELLAQHRGRVDLVLTDIVMPAMRGTELARRLLADAPQLRVLFMSAQPRQDHESIDEAGAATGFIAKPFTLALLAARVREVLDAVPAANY
jgi:two-component system, cell cycle sensor histidine kinase and response regulator CckA